MRRGPAHRLPERNQVGRHCGVAFDPCYHQACDTYADLVARDERTDAAAHTILTSAMTSSSVEGTDGANDNAAYGPNLPGIARHKVTAAGRGTAQADPPRLAEHGPRYWLLRGKSRMSSRRRSGSPAGNEPSRTACGLGWRSIMVE